MRNSYFLSLSIHLKFQSKPSPNPHSYKTLIMLYLVINFDQCPFPSPVSCTASLVRFIIQTTHYPPLNSIYSSTSASTSSSFTLPALCILLILVYFQPSFFLSYSVTTSLHKPIRAYMQATQLFLFLPLSLPLFCAFLSLSFSLYLFFSLYISLYLSLSVFSFSFCCSRIIQM